MTTTQPPNYGWSAVLKWNSTAKPHRVPTWFLKRLRAAAKRAGVSDRTTSDSQMLLRLMQEMWHPWHFDHWGSCVIDGRSVMFAMPYCSTIDDARRVADVIGCDVKSLGVGPWHPDSKLFIFTEPNQ